ncbi:MAG: P-loop NTPase fold protein [Planctomycetota bacterium]
MLKHIPEPEIPAGDPFANDLLDRKTVAENLTQLLANADTPLVMTLSAGWGQGKTTFVKMWSQHLQNENFGTAYFDAWSSDYADDPLVSFIGALEDTMGGEATARQTALESLRKGLKKLVRASPKIAINWALRGGLQYATGGEANAEDEVKAISELAAAMVEQELEKQKSVKEAIESFKTDLSDFAKASSTDGKPLIVFIDELDRCRPDFAVELLERIKHLFAVEGVVFILAVDVDRLGCAAASKLGFPNESRMGYLRRFVDFEYELPKPSPEKLTDSILSGMIFPESYRPSDLSDSVATFAQEEGLSIRDLIRFVQRYHLLANCYQGLRIEFRDAIPFVILESLLNPQSLRKILSDGSTAIKRIQRFQDLMRAESENSNRRHEFQHIGRQYIYILYSALEIALDKEQFEQLKLEFDASYRPLARSSEISALHSLVALAENMHK